MGWLRPIAWLLAVLVAGLAAAATPEADEEAADQEEPTWNVSEPDFSVPPQQAELDLTEGTWMSLDVSPDGETIAFDLLGDIYTIPIAGGEATNISPGFHWDMQPRYSPDGASIAFTSDRAGGNNIWVMDAGGGNPRQITDEDFRLLNNPTWSPDGNYLAARKHFTTQRSLGTGEIWLYHVEGGDGVVVVERPNPKYQKELGEPMFAPGGKAIYYTQNATEGNTFIYAQDTNTEIFQIKKVTLETAETEVVAGGPGGAVRPTPSPDGRYLAFVRRVRADSRLFVKDLVTGEERMLLDSLDQDMQETWAVQGLYPNMDWTPDSESVVFWSHGGIHRIDVASGAVTDIPFHVVDTRTVYEAPRHTVAVAPETVETRMVRWAQRVPGSDAIVFESLGRLYLKSGDAAPRRLTRDDGDHFEFFPAVGPDGRWVYFVSWDDEALGQIRRVRAGGGRSEVLSDAPGHYRELAISPDGETLAVRRSTGGNLLSPLRSMHPGIYVMPSSGGALTLVTEDGSLPHFGAENDRLYVVRDHGEAEEGGRPPQKLTVLDLDGGNAEDLASSRFAREMLVSPTGTHVAWRENYQIYVAPLPRTGKIVELGPDAENLPIRRLSASGGEFPVWSRDGEALSFSLGPRFVTVRLEDAYGEAFEPVAEGVRLAVSVPADRPDGTVALTNARIVTMADAGVIERGTVLVRGNRLVAVGADVDVPADAAVLDLDGKTVVPGLIDIHAHGPYGQELVIPEQNWSLLAHLALGVTTVHNPSSRAAEAFPASEYERAGLILGPRIFSTGEIIYGAKAPVWAPVDTLEDALAHVRRLKAQGAISVKNYNQPRRNQRQMVVEAARRENMMVVTEGGALYHMDMSMVADGNTGIEHSLPQQAIYEDVVQLWRQTNVGFTPTLVVGYGTIEGEDYWYQHREVWKHPILSRWVPPKLLQARSVRRQMAPEEDYGHTENAAIARKLAEAGVLVNIGGHGQREGLAAHWEMWMLVQGGMTPLEALAAATISPAKYMGFAQDLGSLEAGKLADLVVIDGDVTEDIMVSDRVTHVMVNGRLYDSATLTEHLTGDHETAPLYWRGRPESKIR